MTDATCDNTTSLNFIRSFLEATVLVGLLFWTGWSSAEQPDEAANKLLDLHGNIAQRTLNRGDLERAEAMFRDILRRDPDRPNDIAGLAAALARQGKLDQAIDVLRDAVHRFPEDAILASALGQAYLNTKNNRAAMRWLEQAYRLDPAMPDVRYFLGSSYLRCQYPLSALDVLCGAATSRRETEWAQDLAIGTAFGQLGLECQASGYFTSVRRAARETPMADDAVELQDQMDDALFGREYLRGSLKVAERYDTNPGVIPALNASGGALAGTPSWGNLYQGQIAYDLVRDYNHDVTMGYDFLHTSNYAAHAFDLADNSVYLETIRRAYWRSTPVHVGARFDYDHLFVGSDEFLQRLVATPSLTVLQSDWDSTTLLFRYTLFDFLRQGAFDNTPFDLDADNLMVGITRERLLLSRDMAVSAGYQYDQNLSEGDNFDYSGHKLLVEMRWKTPLAGLQLNASGEVHFRRYDHPHSIFGVHRGDKEYLARVALVYPLGRQWWASLEWNYDRNDSNLPINDYRRHSLDLGLEYRFPNSLDEQ